MKNKNQIYLFAVRCDDENGSRFGLPFPGTIETMERDVRESLKGFDSDMVKHYTVCIIAEYHPDQQRPIFLTDTFSTFSVAYILENGGESHE